MDPIRPITPHERDIEPVWRIERAERDAQRRREQQQSEERRERETQQDPADEPVAPPPDDDEPPHLIDVIA